MTRLRNGAFIVLEGPDFCGKGTQVQFLMNYLFRHPQDNHKAINIVTTREPYNTQHTARIRHILATMKNTKDHAEELTTLFIQDRHEHINTCILPSVQRGDIVISDRYKYSTIAYQSLQGMPISELIKRHEGMPIPDLVIFINVPAGQRLTWKANATNRDAKELFDKHESFQQQLDQKYAELKTILSKEPIIVIDGAGTPEQVFQRIKPHVDKLLFP